MLIRAISLAALAVAMTAGFAQAKCDADCRQNEAYLGGVWKNRMPVQIDADTYYVAVVPGNKSALVYWSQGVKTTTPAKIESAASQASGCKARNSPDQRKLSGGPNTPIKTRKFRKLPYLKVSLSC